MVRVRSLPESPPLSIAIAITLTIATTMAISSGFAQERKAEPTSYERATQGTRWLEGGGGFSIKMLVESSNLGGDEVEIGEITFPAGARGSPHGHSRVEIFYILSGELNHIVNDEANLLTPGMVGIVRPGDEVIHQVASEEPVVALVVWAPAGEVDRFAPNLKQRPVDPGGVR